MAKPLSNATRMNMPIGSVTSMACKCDIPPIGAAKNSSSCFAKAKEKTVAKSQAMAARSKCPRNAFRCSPNTCGFSTADWITSGSGCSSGSSHNAWCSFCFNAERRRFRFTSLHHFPRGQILRQFHRPKRQIFNRLCELCSKSAVLTAVAFPFLHHFAENMFRLHIYARSSYGRCAVRENDFTLSVHRSPLATGYSPFHMHLFV